MPRQCATVHEHSDADKDLTGKRFGAWTVSGLSRIKDDKYDKWNCVCDCGITREADGNNLRNGRSTSCGCRRRR